MNNTKLKLLVEEATSFNGVIELNESTGAKNYYIEGIFSTIGQKNRNGRIYPRHLWEREVTKYNENAIAKNTIDLLMEYEHPPRANVDPMKAVGKILELKIEGEYVLGKAKILNDGSNETNKIKSLIDEGFKIGVSSRGVGSVGANSIVEEFEFTTYDIVSDPSDYNANLNGLAESLNKDKYFIVENNNVQCIDGSCSINESNESNESNDESSNDLTEKLITAFKSPLTEDVEMTTSDFIEKALETMGTEGCTVERKAKVKEFLTKAKNSLSNNN